MSKASTTTTSTLLEAANAVVDRVSRPTPLGRVLTRAATLQQATTERLVTAVLQRQAQGTAGLIDQANRELAGLRGEAPAAARATLQATADRLCGIETPNTSLSPSDRADLDRAAARAVEGIDSDESCAAALGRALQGPQTRFTLGVAGGIARHALEHDWDETLSLWCQPGLGDAQGRGGWATVEAWRATRTVLRALEASEWPGPLADAATLADAQAIAG